MSGITFPLAASAGEAVDLALADGGSILVFPTTASPAQFGSGQDGSPVFDGVATFPAFASLVGSVYTLTRDVFWTSPTIAAGVEVKTNGFHIFCAGTLTIAPGAVLSANGKDAVGGTAGGSSALGTLGIGTAGGAGHAAAVGSPGTNQTNTLGDASAAGGAGGAGGANAGGAAGTYVASATNGGANYLVPMLTGFLFTQTSGGNQAGALIIGGGAGGGGGGSDNAGVLGGGGGGGGVLQLATLALANDGTIRARGGAGAAAAGAGGNGGGGGGGGGGIVLSLARFRSGAGVFDVAGGAGGAAFGAGIAGAAGSSGHVNAFYA